jgi:hypothetical protein
LALASTAPSDGLIATSAAAGAPSPVLQRRVDGGGQVGAVGGRRLEERAQPVVGVAGDHRRAGCAPQLLVVARLEPGQAHLVARDDRAVGLLDDLGRGGAHPPEEGGGELARRGEGQRVVDGQRARDLAEGRQHLAGVVLAQHDRLDEGLGAHGLGPGDVRRLVDVEDAGDATGAAGHLGALDLGLVEPVAQDRSLGHEHGTVGTGDVAARGRERAQPEGVALGEVGDEVVGRPRHSPGAPVPALGERHRGLVLPRRAVRDLPAPGERGVGASLLLDRRDVDDVDRDRDLVERGDEVGEGRPYALVDERDLPERVVGERRGEVVGEVAGRVAVLAAEGGAGRRDPHEECRRADTGPETQSHGAHRPGPRHAVQGTTPQA